MKRYDPAVERMGESSATCVRLRFARSTTAEYPLKWMSPPLPDPSRGNKTFDVRDGGDPGGGTSRHRAMRSHRSPKLARYRTR